MRYYHAAYCTVPYYTIISMQYAVCSMQYAVCSMHNTTRSMQYAVYNTQYAVCYDMLCYAMLYYNDSHTCPTRHINHAIFGTEDALDEVDHQGGIHQLACCATWRPVACLSFSLV